jgi:hypothetical protein
MYADQTVCQHRADQQRLPLPRLKEGCIIWDVLCWGLSLVSCPRGRARGAGALVTIRDNWVGAEHEAKMLFMGGWWFGKPARQGLIAVPAPHCWEPAFARLSVWRCLGVCPGSRGLMLVRGRVNRDGPACDLLVGGCQGASCFGYPLQKLQRANTSHHDRLRSD